MDNQQNTSGPMPGDDIRVQNAGTNTGSTGLGNDATVSGAASRKGASARGSAQQPSGAADAQATSQTSGSNDNNLTDTAGKQADQTNGPAGALLDTALSSGKKWIEDSGVLDNVNKLPQSIKDLGARALGRVSGLSTTQKVVGGAILAAGLGWLATRKGKSSGSSDSSSYNYGRQRDAGSYGRKSYGYQAPDASAGRHSDSGSPYGNSGSRYGSSSGSYNTEASSASNSGIKSGSGRDDSGAAYGHASAHTDHGAQSSGSDYKATSNDYRSIE